VALLFRLPSSSFLFLGSNEAGGERRKRKREEKE
jgi:hypothetical protein